MHIGKFNTVQLVDRWEDIREIKNLMGRYVVSLTLKKEGAIFSDFWSRSEDVCLGFNDGYYKGAESVSSYYAKIHEYNALKATVIQKLFPEKLGQMDQEQLHGVGNMELKPISTPVIEIAEDGESAKGIWHSLGTYFDVTPSGPVSFWTMGFYAVDFVKEDGQWRIYDLLYAEDVNSIAGQSWAGEQKPFPELEAFATLKGFELPKPNIPCEVRQLYNPGRPRMEVPRLPEPYTTFRDTFRYGI